MVTSITNISDAGFPFLHTSIEKSQNSNQPQSPTLKFTHFKAKDTQPLQQKPNVQLNLDQTQQIHGHFIKTSSSCSFQLPILALGYYSSGAAIYSFLITSYIKNNCPENAVKIYTYMRRTDTEVDSFIVPSVLKACSLIPSFQLGEEVHDFVVKNGFHGDVFVCNALIMMYGEGGSLGYARQLFDKMVGKDVVSWSTMIRSYGRNRLLDEALDLLKDMRVAGVKPSEIAMISKSSTSRLPKGER
ncbi:pentatricopeptide repeat-containing protein At4g25270, chloroplastic-like [Lotus japonicus]|uniref:pentatricopeptide repeat-containing protein At4g25270, chloroplastic-like n=1 Tax=Lotus japonicus TaxID=34305 RepID=UPI00258CB9F0|nr:pentatricopeptide repeat-containing protein At4g25270, chloroplastic-like [Lotus japonicus]